LTRAKEGLKILYLLFVILSFLVSALPGAVDIIGRFAVVVNWRKYEEIL